MSVQKSRLGQPNKFESIDAPSFFTAPRDSYFGTSSENCQLSTLTASSILSQDLTSDRDWTLFEKQYGGDDCDSGGASSGGSGGTYDKPHPLSNSDDLPQ